MQRPNFLFNFRSYKPKAWYQSIFPTQQSKLEKSLEQYESGLKAYKYHEDLERISGNLQLQRWEDQLENRLLTSALLCAVFGSFLNKMNSFETSRKSFYIKTFQLFCIVIPSVIGYTLFDQRFQVQNRQKYKQPSGPVRVFREYDEQFNLYKDVDLVKNFTDTGRVYKEWDQARQQFYRMNINARKQYLVQKYKQAL